MLKERHRYRAPISTPRRRSNIVPLENVGIVPGNRFILLPLKKVSTIVHRHRFCRSSATSIKTCIVQRSTMISQPVLFQPTVVSAGEVNKSVPRPGVNRSARRLKRRHPAVVRTRLSPVSEQDQEDINFIARDYWSQENRKPVDSSNATAVSRFECRKRVETERLLMEADSRQSPSSSRSKKEVCHKQGEEELSFQGHGENGPRLGVVNNTQSYYSIGNREGPLETSTLRGSITLGQRLEQAKADEKGLGLGALQRELHTRIVRQLSGEPALVITKNQSFNTVLVDELQKRIAEARFRVSASNHAALEQETTSKGAHHQRRGNKRLRKVVLKIHTFGRNRVSPSSGSVGHKPFQVRSVGQQQFALPPPMPGNSVNRRPGRVRSWNEDFHGVGYADVQSQQKFLKGFLCSCTSRDDLPIGPLRTLGEELLN